MDVSDVVLYGGLGVGGLTGVYIAVRRPDWLLGVYAVAATVAVMYIYQLESRLEKA
jgi:hypothetical protein